MRLALLTWAYRKLGRRYPAFFIAVELQAGFPVTAATVVLLGFYYEGSGSEFLSVLAVALGLTAPALPPPTALPATSSLARSAAAGG